MSDRVYCMLYNLFLLLLLQMWSRLLLVSALAAALGRGQASCPEGCTCGPDEHGRKQVVCENGGMTDSSFLNYIDFDTRVRRFSSSLRSVRRVKQIIWDVV